MEIMPGVEREGLGRGRCLIQEWQALVGVVKTKLGWGTFLGVK